jgi:manganese/zinc/iron transport system substrate-binding protein
MFKFRVLFFFLIIAHLPLSIFAKDDEVSISKNEQQPPKLFILTTTKMIQSFVEAIGQHRISSQSLIKEDLDPHSYQLKKGDKDLFDQADLVFYHGLGFEQQGSLVSLLTSDNKSIAVTKTIQKNCPQKILFQQKNQIDPHFWLDLSLWENIIDPITEKLIEKDPSSKTFYQMNATLLKQACRNLHEDLRKTCKSIPSQKRYLATSHDGFRYFARAYLAEEEEVRSNAWEKRVFSLEGFIPEVQVSLQEMKKFLQNIMQQKIFVVFPESNMNPEVLQKVVWAANKKNYPLHMAKEALYGDSVGKTSEENPYFFMLKHNRDVIVKFLKNQSDDQHEK